MDYYRNYDKDMNAKYYLKTWNVSESFQHFVEYLEDNI